MENRSRQEARIIAKKGAVDARRFNSLQKPIERLRLNTDLTYLLAAFQQNLSFLKLLLNNPNIPSSFVLLFAAALYNEYDGLKDKIPPSTRSFLDNYFQQLRLFIDNLSVGRDKDLTSLEKLAMVCLVLTIIISGIAAIAPQPVAAAPHPGDPSLNPADLHLPSGISAVNTSFKTLDAIKVPRNFLEIPPTPLALLLSELSNNNFRSHHGDSSIELAKQKVAASRILAAILGENYIDIIDKPLLLDSGVYLLQYKNSSGVIQEVVVNVVTSQAEYTTTQGTGGALTNQSYQETQMQTSSPTPSPTITSKLEATPTPSTPWCKTLKTANLRNGPSKSYDKLEVIPIGGVFEVLGKNNDGSWFQLRVNNTIGWVSSSLVIAGNIQNIPVVEDPPLPTSTATAVKPAEIVQPNHTQPAKPSAAATHTEVNTNQELFSVPFTTLTGEAAKAYTNNNGSVFSISVEDGSSDPGFCLRGVITRILKNNDGSYLVEITNNTKTERILLSSLTVKQGGLPDYAVAWLEILIKTNNPINLLDTANSFSTGTVFVIAVRSDSNYQVQGKIYDSNEIYAVAVHP